MRLTNNYQRQLEKNVKSLKKALGRKRKRNLNVECLLKDGNRSVPFPTEYSEAEIQASLWKTLKDLGYNARLEVVDKYSRFDIVVFREEKKPIIIEVKKGDVNDVKLWLQSAKQIEKYKCYNAELIICVGMGGIELAIQKIKKESF